MKLLRLPVLVVILLPALAHATGAESTLFYAPAERARVTAERESMLARDSGSGGEVQFIQSVTPDAAAVKAGPPRLEGFSIPGTGRAHAWIGGRRYQEGQYFQGLRVRVMRNGVQLVGTDGRGRLYRVGEAVRDAAPK